MTTFFGPDEASDVDFVEPRPKRDQVACFLHLRDLVYTHPEAAPADAIAFVKKLEAAVIAEKAARERRLADARERGRQKAAAERAEAAKETIEQAMADSGDG
jgi:hypothetical protein